METIKRKNGLRFRESITINGRTIKSPVFRRKTDCKQWLADQRSKRTETALYGDSFKLHEIKLFSEYCHEWILSRKAIGLSNSSIRNYESQLRVHLIPALGKKDLKAISKKDLEAIQARLTESHNPKGTNLIMGVLRSIFKDAQKDNYILRNPIEGLKKIPESSGVEDFWTKSEIDQFLKASYQDKLYDFILIALNTGMRKGEIAGLKWDRVDFALDQITVSRTRDKFELKDTTKTKLKRIIPMNQIVRMTLLKLFQSRIGSEFVFVNRDDSPISIHHTYRDFAIAQEKAGIANQIRFHDLRHTFASQFMMNGGNIFDLQKILGHTDIKMTLRYAHFSPDHLQKAFKGFELGFVNELAQISPTELKTKLVNEAPKNVLAC
jgi:integrase